MDGADLVGYIVAEDERGNYVYACEDDTPIAKREAHRQVLRNEAEEVDACCEECGLELREVHA